MKYGIILGFIAILMLGAIPACGSDSDDYDPSKPIYTDKEVCSNLQLFLVGKIRAAYPSTSSAEALSSLTSQLTPETWKATFQGNGRWTITAIGYDYSTSSLSNNGIWQYLEFTGGITPFNEEAKNYMQQYNLY